MKGAKTSTGVRFVAPIADGADQVPMRGRDFVPRRVYMKPNDYATHGFTEGCKGCVWMQNKLGPRSNHSEACRARMEQKIAEDENDERTVKAK